MSDIVIQISSSIYIIRRHQLHHECISSQFVADLRSLVCDEWTHVLYYNHLGKNFTLVMNSSCNYIDGFPSITTWFKSMHVMKIRMGCISGQLIWRRLGPNSYPLRKKTPAPTWGTALFSIHSQLVQRFTLYVHVKVFFTRHYNRKKNQIHLFQRALFKATKSIRFEMYLLHNCQLSVSGYNLFPHVLVKRLLSSVCRRSAILL